MDHTAGCALISQQRRLVAAHVRRIQPLRARPDVQTQVRGFKGHEEGLSEVLEAMSAERIRQGRIKATSMNPLRGARDLQIETAKAYLAVTDMAGSAHATRTRSSRA